jgi:hypothetical protein
MTSPTKLELATGTIELWADWLRGALIAFTTTVPFHRRARAFAPFDIDPATQSPAGDIVEQIRQAVLESNVAPAKSAVEVLRSWSIPHDGWEGVAILIQVVMRFGGAGMASAIMRVIGQAERLPPDAQGELAFLAMEAAGERFRRSEISELARQLWRLDLLKPQLAADLAVYLTRDDFAGLQALPRTIVLLLPGITDESCQSAYVDAIAEKLRRTQPPHQLEWSLLRDAADTEVQAIFRGELRKIVAPWSDQETILFTITPSTADEASRRTDSLESKARLPSIWNQYLPSDNLSTEEENGQ